MIMLLAVTLYATAGTVIAAAFLAFGVTRVLPAPAAVTLGARIMLFPGAVALWPILALAVALGFAMALTLRPPPNVEAPGAAGEVRP